MGGKERVSTMGALAIIKVIDGNQRRPFKKVNRNKQD